MDMSVVRRKNMREYMESFGKGIVARERVLDFALSYDLTVINSCFRKREKDYIT